MSQPEGPILYTTDELCAKTGVNRKTLYNLRASGRVTAVKNVGSDAQPRWVYLEAAVQEVQTALGKGEQWMTATSATKYLNISRQTFYSWLERHPIEAHDDVTGTRYKVYARADLDALAKANGGKLIRKREIDPDDDRYW